VAGLTSPGTDRLTPFSALRCSTARGASGGVDFGGSPGKVIVESDFPLTL